MHPRSPQRGALMAALLLLALLVGLVVLPTGDRADSVSPTGGTPVRPAAVAPTVAAPAPEPTQRPTPPPASAADAAPLRQHIRSLVAAMDRGEPVRIIVGGREPTTFVTRPRTLLADTFQISLGVGSPSGSTFDPQIVRVYDARGITFAPAPAGATEESAGVEIAQDTDASPAPRLGSHATITVVDNALSAVIMDEDGSVTRLRTDETTGEFLTLREDADDVLGTCAHDLEQGIATVSSDREPATDADWQDGPRALVETAAADTPEIANAGGVNPANGRLDKYLDPLPLGRNYDLSLKDMLVLIVLDKDATGANTAPRLATVASEYLARMANVAAVHEHQLGIRLLVQELILTPNTAEFADIPPSLSEFRDWVNVNRQRGTYLWNAAAKFGLTATDGGVLGVGYVSALSGSFGVSVNNKGFTHALVAHEMGHNMGSGHSGGGIMNSSIIVGARSFFQDVTTGETAAKDIYDHTSSRIFGAAPMRHPEEIPFANDDDRTTAVNTPITFNPVGNDANVVRNGTPNAVLTLEEVSRVQPLSAGTVAISGANEVTFTPAAGFQGIAFFSYSIRGDVGNGGQGWLHKGDAAVQVGAYNPDSLNLTLAPGQVFSFRPSGGGDVTIQNQPASAIVDTSRDDRQLVIVRVEAGATGTDSFVIRKNGTDSTVTITYLPASEYLVANPDFIFSTGANNTLTFNPLVNDQGGGYLSPVTVNPVLSGSGGRIITYYFRHRFSLNNPADFTGLNLELLRDDGAIVYLNGGELGRDNMPAGAVDASTLASGTAGGADETTYFAFNGLPAAQLVQGINVIAVELHQASATSSDVGFDLSLTATGPGGDRTLVPRNATWSYLDDGSDQGVAWRDPNFDDGNGETVVSFGPDPANKYVTTYFRKRFTVADPAGFASLTLRARRDDGVVLYLNGVEVGRSNMPAGAIGFSTFAAAAAPDDGDDFQTFTIAAGNLVAGTNVLAAEIHQSSPTSSDITFDLDLAGNVAGGSPVYLVGSGEDWKYLDNGSNQGTAWRAPAFDDSAWAEDHAPLGYGFGGSTQWAEGPGIFGFGDDVEATTLREGGEGLALLPGAFRVISATNLTPSKGNLVFNETLRFTVDNSVVNARTGLMTFTPAVGATGVASVEYVIEDGAGNQQTGVVTIVLALVDITTPVDGTIGIDLRNELLVEGILHNGGGAPLSGIVTPEWSLVSAPEGGAVTFSNPGGASSRASFSAPGNYVLRLTGTDNGLSTFQEREVRVTEGSRLDEALVARWPLDDTGGTGVSDVSGNGNNGVRVGNPTPDTGIIGGAYTFDATNRYADFSAHVDAFQNLPTGTLSMWFRTNTGSERTLFSATDSGDADRDLRLYMQGGLLQFAVRSDVGTPLASLRSTAQVNDNEWHHAAVTVDGTQNAVLYIDGVANDSGVRPFFGGVQDIDVIRLGQTVNSGSANTFYRGSLDEVRVYGRVLAPSEIAALAAGSINQAPLVILPPTRPVTGASPFALSLLTPAITDDGLPGGGGVIQWRHRSGPATATFASAGTLATSVTFPTPGTYVLELRADDSGATSIGSVAIDYTGQGNGVPFALGLADVVVPQNAPDTSIDLFAAFQDGQDPDTALTFTVTGNTNPGLFSSADIVGTDPRRLVLDYAPGASGSTLVTVRATDTGGQFVQSSFTVTVENFGPSIPGQFFTVEENSAPGTLVGALAASDPDGDPVEFALLSGNTGGHFTIGRATGEIRIAPGGRPDFETAASHFLTVAVTDATHPSFGSTATVRINVTDVNEQPDIPNAFLTVAEGAAAGSVLASLTATDPDGRPLTFSITAGNTSGAFAIDAADGFLSVANPAALNLSTSPKFVLTIRVLDDGAPALQDTAEVHVAVARTLLAEGAPARAIVPVNNSIDAVWRGTAFDDSGWTGGTTGVGYDTDPDYDPLIGLDVETAMSGVNGTVYIRVPFSVAGSPAAFGTLTLDMKYDDGFVAYLNAKEIARANAPGTLAWNVTASGGHNDDDAQIFEPFDASGELGSLVSGSNTLAIHGLNTTLGSSDLLMLPRLTASAVGTAGLPAPPEVTLSGATAISDSSAVLRGNLTRTGGTNPALTFVWGTRDGGDDPARWENASALGTRPVGGYSFAVDSLPTGRTIFYNLVASHSGGTVVAPAPATFVTLLGDAIVLVPEGAPARGFVPTGPSAVDAVWRERGFDSSGWASGNLGAGYENGTGYASLIGAGLEFGAAMFNTNATVYVRVPFTPADPAAIGRLVLRMKYDDGFVAYLNGIEVARRNAFPGAPVWNATASALHDDAAAVVFEDIDISGSVGLLAAGENILAVNGLNDSPGSSDMLISPELLGYVIDTFPTGPDALFQTWATTVNGLAGADALLTADPDRDGRSNLLEYGTGDDPNSGTQVPPAVSATILDDRLHISFRRRNDAAVRGLSYRVQTLNVATGTWANAAIEATVSVTPDPNGLTETVTVRLGGTDPATVPTTVARVAVDYQP